MQGLLGVPIDDIELPAFAAWPSHPQASHPRTSSRRRLLFRLVALCTSLAIACACRRDRLGIGGYGRSYTHPMGSFFTPDNEMGYHGKPNFSGRFRGADFDVVVEHDENGFRRAEAIDAADSHEIYVLGDSFVWGYGIGQHDLLRTKWAACWDAGPQPRPHRRRHRAGVPDLQEARRVAAEAGRHGCAGLLRQRLRRQRRQASQGPRLRDDGRRAGATRSPSAAFRSATMKELAQGCLVPLQLGELLHRPPPGCTNEQKSLPTHDPANAFAGGDPRRHGRRQHCRANYGHYLAAALQDACRAKRVRFLAVLVPGQAELGEDDVTPPATFPGRRSRQP